MEKESKSIIEAMLFVAGREIKIDEIKRILDISEKEIDEIINCLKIEYENRNSGLEIIKVEDSYQMCAKKEMYEWIYPLFDNRTKPSLSAAAMETLSIIAYNPNITRAEIEQIRGVASDSSIYKLLEYNLIEEGPRLDMPGRPRAYKTSSKFLKTFGLSSLDELPELPRYKIDENEQIVLDDFIEAPEPEREAQEIEKIDLENKKKEAE